MKKFCSVMVALICVCSSFLYAFADTPSELPPEADGSGYARDYLLEGESWLCEEHAVIYDPAFPDNVCERCLHGEYVVPYSGSFERYSLAAVADSPTIQDNLFQPYGVVYRSGNSSWTHCTFNETSGYQFTNPYTLVFGSDRNSIFFGFQQLQNVTLTSESWVCFSLDIRDSSGNVAATSANFSAFQINFKDAYTGSTSASPRTVLDMSEDGKYFYALRVPSTMLNKPASYFSFRFISSSGFTLKSNWTYTINDIQLYSGGSADAPPDGWAGGTSGGGGISEPSDIDLIGGWFNAIFEWLSNIRDNIANGFSGLASSLSSGFSNLMDTVSNAAGSIVSGLTGWWDEQFSGAVNPDIGSDSGSIDSTLQEQEQLEAPFWDGLQDSSDQWSQQDLSIPLDVANSITFVLTCFTGLFNGLGSYKPVFLFVPAVGIALALLGRMGSVIPGASRVVIRESRKKEGS